MTWSELSSTRSRRTTSGSVSYVPDNVLTPLIKSVTSENYFISVNATREDEAMGMVAGAWMGGGVRMSRRWRRTPLKSGVMRTASSTARAATTR